MDIFRFMNPDSPTKMQNGTLVNTPLLNVTWAERYRDTGEFEINAYVNTGIRSALPVGSFISKVNSTTIMIVENHEIGQDDNVDQTVKITGRAFESFLEQRIVGSNQAFPTVGDPHAYVLAADHTGNQAVKLIQDHVMSLYLVDDGNALPYFEAVNVYTFPTGDSYARTLKRGDVYSQLLEILAVDNLGLKTVRPGTWSPASTPENTAFVVYRGANKTKEVIFSYDSGELTNSDYLWSQKGEENSAFVSGKWVEVFLPGTETGINRRTMLIDATDIDQAQTVTPTGATRDLIVAAMNIRGSQTLATKNKIALVKTELVKTGTPAIFRRDFDLGDIVTVVDQFHEVVGLRVTEYTEIEDENGLTAYPTLSLP